MTGRPRAAEAEIDDRMVGLLARGETVTVRVPEGVSELRLRLSGKAVLKLGRKPSLFDRVFGRDE